MDAHFSLQQAIQEHLELTRRNAALADTMPLDRYLESPPTAEQPSKRPVADPWQDGLWSAPPSFDWGD
jgi:hypothetical protein